jgi:hypothetical protein
MRSDALLRHGGIDRARERLAGVRAPRVAIIGASTSAIACAVQLLKCHDLPFGAEAITLIARTPPKPFFPTVEAAHAEGFTDFTPDDICPVSGFVLRLRGCGWSRANWCCGCWRLAGAHPIRAWRFTG